MGSDRERDEVRFRTTHDRTDTEDMTGRSLVLSVCAREYILTGDAWWAVADGMVLAVHPNVRRIIDNMGRAPQTAMPNEYMALLAAIRGVK